MKIKWKDHARQRFWERIARFDIGKEEVEWETKKQTVRFFQSETNTIKTIFEIREKMVTVIKTETVKKIQIISIWESNEYEVKAWMQKQTNASAAGPQS